jgi:NitT/TauT family transport system substrate-binding protein
MFTIVVRTLFCVSLLLLITTCHLKPQSPLKVGTNVWTGYELFYLARHLGYYQNTPIKMVELPSATEVSHAFRNHLLDVAALTLDEVLTLSQYENDIRIITVLDISNGADVLLANPAITTLNAIKGKRIGVENLAVGAILLDSALTAAHLKSEDITLVPLNVDEHLKAYQQNKIDAVVTFEPVKSQLIQLGARQLYDSSKMPHHIIDVLVTHQSVIEHRPDELKQLVTAYFKALAYFKTHPKPAATVMSGRLMVTAEAVILQFNGLILPDLSGNSHFLAGQKPILNQAAQHLANLMLQQQLLFKAVTTDHLINNSFLSTAMLKS